MSRSVWLLVPFLFVAFAAFARAELVAHWAMDATSADGSVASRVGGSMLAGKLVGDARLEPNVSDGTITRASALALDGQGDWLQINHPVAKLGDGKSFTLAAWIKTSGSGMAVLSKDNADGTLDVAEKILFVNEESGGRNTGFVGCSQEWVSATVTQISDGRWRHVAVVYDALFDTRRVFVDGQDLTSENSWSAGPDHGRVVRIGTSDWADADDFHGHLDDVAIYDQALSPRQIRTLMTDGPKEFEGVVLAGLSKAEADQDPWRALMRVRRAVVEHRRAGMDEDVQQAGVELGPWYCTGPFKAAAESLHLDAFESVFPPEKQVLAAGRKAIDLAQTWRVDSHSNQGEVRRGWAPHPEWADGYVNPLPVGPPPMKSETCYLYRTVTARRACCWHRHRSRRASTVRRHASSQLVEKAWGSVSGSNAG